MCVRGEVAGVCVRGEVLVLVLVLVVVCNQIYGEVAGVCGRRGGGGGECETGWCVRVRW